MSWPKTELKNVGSFLNGVNFKSDDKGSGRPMINVKDITSSHFIDQSSLDLVDTDPKKKYYANPDDIFFVRSSVKLEGIGLVGKVRESANGVVHCGFVIRFRPRSGDIHSDYLLYLLKTPRYRKLIMGLSSGTSIVNLSQRNLKTLEIPIPSLPVQRRIASILSAYDDLIETNEQRIERLERAAHLLFREWFVHLRFPGHEHTSVEDGVPAGWERVVASDIIAVKPKVPTMDGEIRYVPMGAIPEGRMTIDPSETRMREKFTSARFRNRDVLFARITPSLENGKTAFVQILDEGEIACGSTEFIVLRGDRVSPEFTYCLSRTHDFRQNAIKSMTGSSGRQRVQTECFDRFEMGLPPQHLRDEFDAQARPCFEQIRALQKQNAKLREARDLLLPRLMNEEIEV